MVMHFINTLSMLIWHMVWPLVFGFAFSACIRSYVSSETIIKHLGKNGFISCVLAVLFGAVSSVCNYATVGMGHTLRLKGASWPNTLGYMIASTNLGITMIIAVYGFLGAIFLKVMIGAAMAFLIIGYILCCICMGDNPVEPAEQQEMMMDKKSRWQAACDFFREDLDMTRKDILVGFIVASAVGVMMPPSWWQMIFWSYQDFGALAWVWNAAIGIIITVLTFGCSIGNVSLAAVMWWNGVPAGGVMAFLMACLLTFPMLKITHGYYGKSVTIRQALIQVAAIILAAVSIDWFVLNASIHLEQSDRLSLGISGHSDLTLLLNSILGSLGVLMYRKGKGMAGDMSM
ncbi:permease [uncultured Endozoicomonas sp.]|uniref:permease n=1 Tax=uncultured Endozoicomonas sp. TaxID=432652 RepID=UPI00262CFFCF|nr:permease [uncultured Endozoicomonas sp.]